MKKILAVTITGILSAGAIAHADDNINLSELLHGKFSGNFGAVSDYKFRGISQTMQAPAAQGNIDFLHENGVKIGFAGSNVDFGGTSDATLEGDVYTSYNKSFDKLSTEIGLIYYSYPGAKSHNNYNYTEFYENLGYDFGKAQVGVSFNYSPEFFADSGSAYYPRFTVTVPLPKNFALDGWIGHQWVENNIKYGVPDYTDYQIGLSYKIDGFTIKASYVDTNLNHNQCASDLCAGEGVISISKAF